MECCHRLQLKFHQVNKNKYKKEPTKILHANKNEQFQWERKCDWDANTDSNHEEIRSVTILQFIWRWQKKKDQSLSWDKKKSYERMTNPQYILSVFFRTKEISHKCHRKTFMKWYVLEKIPICIHVIFESIAWALFVWTISMWKKNINNFESHRYNSEQTKSKIHTLLFYGNETLCAET